MRVIRSFGIVGAAAIALSVGSLATSWQEAPARLAAATATIGWTAGPRLGGFGAVIGGDALARTRGAADVLHGAVTKDGGVRYRRLGVDGWEGTRINPATQYATRAVVEVARSRVFVAWMTLSDPGDIRKGSPLYLRSVGSDGAGGWGPVRLVTSLDVRADAPSLAATRGRVYVAYTDRQTGAVKVALSRDRGATWRTRSIGRSTRRSYVGLTGYPVVVARGSEVAVAWVKDAEGKVRFRRSTDGGTSWHKARTLGTGSVGDSQLGLAMRGDRIAVAWADGDSVHVRIRGATGWGVARTIEPPATPKTYSAVLDVDVDLHGATAAGVAFSACWAECGPDWPESADVLWTESTDNGGTWVPPRVVLAGAEDPTANGSVVVFRADLLWAQDGTRYLAANKVIDADLVFVPFRRGVEP